MSALNSGSSREIHSSKQRNALIRAALTVILAYDRMSRPKVAMDLGSFESWCHTVRNPLISARCADPAPCMRRLPADNPTLADLEALLRAWHTRQGDGAGSEVI